MLILLYHRVADVEADPQLLCVTPQHFAEQVEILRADYYPMPLHQAIEAICERKIPRRAIAVTFDDGYADNLHIAKPLLERYSVPATIYMATGFIDQTREFWWDELVHLLLDPGSLPASLHLDIRGANYNWNLGAATGYTREDYQGHCRWTVRDSVDPGPRQSLYRSLCQLLRPLQECERQRILREIREWAGKPAAICPDHRILTDAELLHLGDGTLCDIGAHTVNHPMLAALSPAQQLDEIKRSKAALEELLGRRITSFAYPYGSRSDYTSETVGALREAGFTSACSTYTDVVWRNADPFQLSRVTVRDWDGDYFSRILRGWFNG